MGQDATKSVPITDVAPARVLDDPRLTQFPLAFSQHATGELTDSACRVRNDHLHDALRAGLRGHRCADSTRVRREQERRSAGQLPEDRHVRSGPRLRRPVSVRPTRLDDGPCDLRRGKLFVTPNARGPQCGIFAVLGVVEPPLVMHAVPAEVDAQYQSPGLA